MLDELLTARLTEPCARSIFGLTLGTLHVVNPTLTLAFALSGEGKDDGVAKAKEEVRAGRGEGG